MSQIAIYYNVYETIEEQLKAQGYKCKDIQIYEKAKDSIQYLWFHNFLTDVEHDKLINKLHKTILKNVEKVEG